MPRRPRNAMTRMEAQAADTKMSPHEWEKAVMGLLRCNGWEFHHERDRAGGAKNNARKKGFPDFPCFKKFTDWKLIPELLLAATRLDRPGAISHRFPTITIHGIIEAKTGSGVPSDKQWEWIWAARNCPGHFGIVVYPTDRAWLIQLLGGNEPVR